MNWKFWKKKEVVAPKEMEAIRLAIATYDDDNAWTYRVEAEKEGFDSNPKVVFLRKEVDRLNKWFTATGKARTEEFIFNSFNGNRLTLRRGDIKHIFFVN